jgi:hypothetical protein
LGKKESCFRLDNSDEGEEKRRNDHLKYFHQQYGSIRRQTCDVKSVLADSGLIFSQAIKEYFLSPLVAPVNEND